MAEFKWPTVSQRVMIVGSNGSGKSQMAAHILSNAPFNKQPYVVIDYKGEELLRAIPGAHFIGPKDKVPKEPGVYILEARPELDDDAVGNFLWRVHAKEKTGLVFDEGYMIPVKNGALNALYTQGRSKKIPIITLSQRPVWLSRFAFSEANHFVYMRLNDRRDRDQIRSFVPMGDDLWNLDMSLPEYHARWYDVNRNLSFHILPAPDAESILDMFENRLKPKRKVYL